MRSLTKPSKHTEPAPYESVCRYMNVAEGVIPTRDEFFDGLYMRMVGAAASMLRKDDYLAPVVIMFCVAPPGSEEQIVTEPCLIPVDAGKEPLRVFWGAKMDQAVTNRCFAYMIVHEGWMIRPRKRPEETDEEFNERVRNMGPPSEQPDREEAIVAVGQYVGSRPIMMMIPFQSVDGKVVTMDVPDRFDVGASDHFTFPEGSKFRQLLPVEIIEGAEPCE